MASITQESLTKIFAKVKSVTDTKANKDAPEFTSNVSLGRSPSVDVGEYSAAFGLNVGASGNQSFANGSATRAIGIGSHAEGRETKAYGNYSHAEGQGTLVYSDYGYVAGKYNVADNSTAFSAWESNKAYAQGNHVKNNSKYYYCKLAHTSGSSFDSSKWTEIPEQTAYAEVIGNGSSQINRSNARVLDWNGNERIKGNLYVGCNADSTGGTMVATINDVPDVSGKADKTNTVLSTYLSRGRKANTTAGTGSLAFGNNVEASGNYSQAFGNGTKANREYAYAEGYSTTASGQSAHAEGSESTASNTAAHAEGQQTTASGAGAHSEGTGTIAAGGYSHAEGVATTANRWAQHVFGEYNVVDTAGEGNEDRGAYVEIVGNGDDDDNKSNARALDWNGNERLMGNVYVGCNADSTGGSKLATETYVTTQISQAFSAQDAMIFKGTIGTGGTVTTLPNDHQAGWTYRVITAGTYAGKNCEIGDLIICVNDGTTASNDDWTVAQTNIDGAVTGPTSSTGNNLAAFNGTSGKTIKDSGIALSDVATKSFVTTAISAIPDISETDINAAFAAVFG